MVLTPDQPNDLAALTGWEIDFKQLEPAKLDTRFVFHATQDAMFGHFSMNGKVHQRGVAPKGMLTFGIVDPDTISSFQSGPVAQDSLLSFNASGGYDSLTEKGHNGLILSFREDAFLAFAENCGIELPDFAQDVGMYRATGKRHCLARLDQTVKALLSRQTLVVTEKLQEDLMLCVLERLANPKCVGDTSSLNARHRCVARAIELMDDTAGEALLVSDICTQTGVSWRTLDRAFKDCYGIGPKSYLNKYRLNKVRYDLMRHGRNRSIVDVANMYDFWHMGQFAKDYKNLFGELPSDTVRAAGRCYAV